MWGDFSGFELFTIGVSSVGFVWWLAAMYWQVKQGTAELQKISGELQGQQQALHRHEMRLQRVEDQLWPNGAGRRERPQDGRA